MWLFLVVLVTLAFGLAIKRSRDRKLNAASDPRADLGRDGFGFTDPQMSAGTLLGYEITHGAGRSRGEFTHGRGRTWVYTGPQPLHVSIFARHQTSYENSHTSSSTDSTWIGTSSPSDLFTHDTSSSSSTDTTSSWEGGGGDFGGGGATGSWGDDASSGNADSPSAY